MFRRDRGERDSSLGCGMSMNNWGRWVLDADLARYFLRHAMHSFMINKSLRLSAGLATLELPRKQLGCRQPPSPSALNPRPGFQQLVDRSKP